MLPQLSLSLHQCPAHVAVEEQGVEHRTFEVGQDPQVEGVHEVEAHSELADPRDLPDRVVARCRARRHMDRRDPGSMGLDM